jgi:hypothetical protein
MVGGGFIRPVSIAILNVITNQHHRDKHIVSLTATSHQPDLW